MLRYLVVLFFAPVRLLKWLAKPSPEVVRARTEHPNGGRCHWCGTVTEADTTECNDCHFERKW
jgi:hypothetical protein